MTALLLITGILVWPFGQLLLLSPLSSPFRVHLLDVVAVLLFLSLLVSSHRKIIKDPLSKPLAILILAGSLSLLVNFNLVTVSTIAYFLRFIAYTSFYFAFRLESIKKYIRLLLLSAVIFLILGFLQYLLLPDVRFLAYLGYDDHYYRLIGSFLDPNFSGLILSIFVLLSPWPTLLLPLTGLALTFSRASFLSLGIGLLYLSLAKKQFKLLVSLLLLLIFLYFAPKPFGEGVNLLRTFSITSRFENQKNALQIFAKHPLFGVGFNTLKQVNNTPTPNLTSGVDNSFLFVLVTTGILGFSTFIYFLKSAWQISKSSLARASLLALFSHSLFNNSFFYSWILVLFFLLLNLGVSPGMVARRDSSQVKRPKSKASTSP